MSITAAAIRIMAEKGLSALDIAEIAEAMAIDPVRSSAAARQKRYRDRMDIPPREWADIREAVFERDGYICTYCGAVGDLAGDHIIPLIQGGASSLENLTTACRSCNCGKAGRTPKEWLS